MKLKFCPYNKLTYETSNFLGPLHENIFLFFQRDEIFMSMSFFIRLKTLFIHWDGRNSLVFVAEYLTFFTTSTSVFFFTDIRQLA